MPVVTYFQKLLSISFDLLCAVLFFLKKIVINHISVSINEGQPAFLQGFFHIIVTVIFVSDIRLFVQIYTANILF